MRLFTLSLVFLLVAACGTSSGPSSDMRFSYRGYDAEGSPISSGWFSLVEEDSASFSGEWHFTAFGNPEDIGPQIGDGVLVGSREADTLRIGLNPQYMDNNVSLCGVFDGRTYEGGWLHSSYLGVTNWGTFEATLK